MRLKPVVLFKLLFNRLMALLAANAPAPLIVTGALTMVVSVMFVDVSTVSDVNVVMVVAFSTPLETTPSLPWAASLLPGGGKLLGERYVL